MWTILLAVLLVSSAVTDEILIWFAKNRQDSIWRQHPTLSHMTFSVCPRQIYDRWSTVEWRCRSLRWLLWVAAILSSIVGVCAHF